MAQNQTLIDKHRPQSLADYVLPSRHSLGKALEFLESPYPSAWLLHGPPGLGKTSLAMMMARAAIRDSIEYQHIPGPDLTIELVRELARTCGQRSMYGGLHAVVVDESDAIPRAAQVRLLSVLENLNHAVIVFTSNQDIDEFEPRMLSRLRPQLFTSQGLLRPGTDWLLAIAAKEGIDLPRKAAERMIVLSKSNLRAALQMLDLHHQRAPLPTKLAVMDIGRPARSAVEPVSSC
jgi:putative ATPase